jgi:hypothetical protein
MRKLVTISFPEDLLASLDSRAEEDGKKRSSLIVQAVRQFLDGPNGPKIYEVIPEELIQFGKTLSLGLVESIQVSVKQALSSVAENPKKSETPKLTLYRPEEILVEPTPGTLGSVEAFTVVPEEVPIEEVKEKVSKGTCKDCGGVNYSHFKSCTKRKK